MQANFVKSFLLALAASSVSALSIREVEFRCGAPAPGAESVAASNLFAIQEAEASVNATLAKRATINVDTYVHVVASSTSASAGYLSDATVAAQIKVMNEDYAASGFQFTLKGTDRTVNSAWASDGSETAMKRSLRKGNYRDLNLYFLSTIPDGILGYCYFPTTAAAGSSNFILDGCTIASGTVPGGTISPRFNLGKTATHEVGHWMGLYHTFQGGCSGSGDMVSDTPAQSSASSGCPVGRDSCPSIAGVDPIHNYMDYSDDSCYEEFTTGQNARMVSSWNQFRAGK